MQPWDCESGTWTPNQTLRIRHIPVGKVFFSCLALMQVLYSFAQNQDLSKDRTPKSHAWVFGRDEAPDFRGPNWDTWCNTWIGITVVFVFLKDCRENILVQCASTANSSTLFLYHNISELSNLMPSFSRSGEQWHKSLIICCKIRDYTSQWYRDYSKPLQGSRNEPISTTDWLCPGFCCRCSGASCVLHRFDFCKPVGWQLSLEGTMILSGKNTFAMELQVVK